MMHTVYLHPPPREQTDTCENITFPKTSFAGGNKLDFRFGPAKSNIRIER